MLPTGDSSTEPFARTANQTLGCENSSHGRCGDEAAGKGNGGQPGQLLRRAYLCKLPISKE